MVNRLRLWGLLLFLVLFGVSFAVLAQVIPRLVVTDQDSIVVDANSNSLADAGDTIRYTVVIANCEGDTARDVVFESDIDNTTTLNPSSVTVIRGQSADPALCGTVITDDGNDDDNDDTDDTDDGDPPVDTGAPDAVNDLINVSTGTVVIENILANDTGDNITAFAFSDSPGTPASTPADGVTTLTTTTPDGDIVFILNAAGDLSIDTTGITAGASGTVTLYYIISAADWSTDLAQVEIVYGDFPVADDDTAANGIAFVTPPNTPFNSTSAGYQSLLANDALGNPAATLVSFGGGDLGGTVTDNASPGTAMATGIGTLDLIDTAGNFAFFPDAAFIGSTFTFNYRIENAFGFSDGTVEITVAGAPDAVDDAYTVSNGATTTDNVTANDTGVVQVNSFGDSLANVGTTPADGVTALSLPAGAGAINVTIDAAGAIAIDATTATGSGTVTLFYELAGLAGLTDTAQVDIAFGDFPVAADDTAANGVAFITSVNTTFDNTSAGYQTLLTNDTLGTPAATLVSFGGGDLGGTVTDNTAPAAVNAAGFGTLTILDNAGNVEFVPETGFIGTFTFQYRIENAIGFSDGTVEITVAGAPDAVDDAYTVSNGATTTDNVTTNDTGVVQVVSFGDSLANVGTTPADGVTVLSVVAGGGTIDVTIDATGAISITANGTTGSGTITLFYLIEGDAAQTDTAQIDITYGDFPVAADDTAANGVSFETGINTTFDSGSVGYQTLLSNDTLGTPAATLVSFGGGDLGGAVTDNTAPATVNAAGFGTLTILDNAGNVEFVPETGFIGTFTFQYRIENAIGFSDATVEIAVFAAPVAVDDAYTVSNGATTTDNVTTNDTDVVSVISFGDSLANVGTTPADGVTLLSVVAGVGTIDVTIDAAGAIIIDATTATGSGTITLFYQVQGNASQTDTAQIDIAFGDFPVAADDTAANGVAFITSVNTTFDNTSAGYQTLLSNDTLGTPAATLVSWGGGDASANVDLAAGASRPLAGGTLTVNADGSFDLVSPTVPGIYTFDYIIDNGIGSSQATVEIYVNDPPIAQNDTLDVSVAQVTNFPAPTLFDDNGAGADYLGVPPATLVSFGGGSFVGTVTDNPAGVTVPIPALGGTLTINADGSLAIDTPITTGTFTVQYQLDNGFGTSVATVTINVLSTPITQDDDFFVLLPNNLAGDLIVDNGFGVDDPGVPAFTSLTFGAGDLGGAVTSNTGGSSVTLADGTLTVNNDGTFTLNGATIPGTYSFDYQLENTNGLSNISTVTIEVVDPPVAQDDALDVVLGAVTNLPAPGVFADNGSGADYLGVPVATLVSFGSTDLGGADAADNPAGATVMIPVYGGMITINGDGSLTVSNPTAAGSFFVDYVIDNGFATSIGRITITILEAPIAQPDSYTFLFDVDQNVAAGSGLFVNNGSGADIVGSPAATLTSFGGGDLSAAVTDNPAGASDAVAGGTLTVNNDGSWSLTGQPFTPGQYTFDYRLQNAAGSSDATVTLNILSPPTAVADVISVGLGASTTQAAATGLRDTNDDYTLPNVYDDATITAASDTDNTVSLTIGTPYAIPGTGGATLTINADGSYTLDAIAATSGGLFNFEYTLSNSHPTPSIAALTVTIQAPPDGFDDSGVAVLAGTSAPGDPFHVALNAPAALIGNVYVDNGGFGADDLGLPAAPTDAPADVINNIALGGVPDAATGIIGGGNIVFGGDGGINIATNGDLTVEPPTDFVGLITFDYTLANSIGTDTTPAAVSLAVGNRPVCGTDTYTATGNIGIDTSLIPNNDVLQNDTGDLIAIDSADTISSSGGVVDMTLATGNFTYTPPTGFTGPDSFSYVIGNGFDAQTCTVEITVSDMIYFMDSAAAGGGDGSLATPFSGIADHNSSSKSGMLFVNDNAADIYNGNLQLVGGQTVIGEGATGTLFGAVSRTGITLAPLSVTIPYSLTGNQADWPQFQNTAGDAITVLADNELVGISIGNTPTGTGLVDGSAIGTLTISETEIVGTGGIINIVNGGTAVNATFTSLTTTSAPASGIAITDVAGGSLISTTTTISGVTGDGITIANSGLSSNLGTTSVTHSATGDAVNLNTNTGTFTMAATTITAANGDAFSATNQTGTITVTGTGSFSATGGACFTTSAATATPLNVTMNTCSATNPASTGLLLSNAGGTQFVIQNATTISGAGGQAISLLNADTDLIDISDGSTVTVTNRSTSGFVINGSDGTAVNVGNYTDTNGVNAGGYGVFLTANTAPIDFDATNISNANATTPETRSGGSATGAPTNNGDGDAIFITNNTGSFTSNGGTITSNDGNGVDHRTSGALNLNGVTIVSSTEHGVRMFNSANGTSSSTGLTLQMSTTGAFNGFFVQDEGGAGAPNITLTDPVITNSNATEDGVLVDARAASMANITFTMTGTNDPRPVYAGGVSGRNCSVRGFEGDSVQFNAAGNATVTTTLNQCYLGEARAGTGAGGFVAFASNTATLSLTMTDNYLFDMFNTAFIAQGALDVNVSNTAIFRGTITGNAIRDTNSRGIDIIANQSTTEDIIELNVNISGNYVDGIAPATTSIVSRYINIGLRNDVTDRADIQINNNVLGSQVVGGCGALYIESNSDFDTTEARFEIDSNTISTDDDTGFASTFCTGTGTPGLSDPFNVFGAVGVIIYHTDTGNIDAIVTNNIVTNNPNNTSEYYLATDGANATMCTWFTGNSGALAEFYEIVVSAPGIHTIAANTTAGNNPAVGSFVLGAGVTGTCSPSLPSGAFN